MKKVFILLVLITYVYHNAWFRKSKVYYRNNFIQHISRTGVTRLVYAARNMMGNAL